MKIHTEKYGILSASRRWISMLAAFTLLTAWYSGLAQTRNVQVNGITIAYESMGSEKNEPILLISGTGMQLISWPLEFCNELVRHGYRVIRFDNRDTGLSTKFDEAGEPDWPAIFTALAKGEPAPVAYTADDLAKDAEGLLDALGIKKAHMVGISGGAIVAQIVAAQYPEHTLSLTSLMGTTGNPALPSMKPEIQQLIMSNLPPAPGDTAAIINRQVKIMQAIGSPAYPTDEKLLRHLVLLDTRRCYDPEGASRQGVAVLVAGDRRQELKTIQVPTVVLHGADDPMVPVAAGKEVAATIPHATLRIIPGLGHDMPAQLINTFVEAVISAASGTHAIEGK